MKKSNGPRVQAFLKETGEGNVFKEIEITRDGNDVAQYEKIKKSVLDEIGQSITERFHLFNDPVVKASSVLDPETWPGDPEELASFGYDQLQIISNRYQGLLEKAGFRAECFGSEWQGVKSLVSLIKHKTTPDIYSVLFSKHEEEFPNVLLITEIVLTWPLSTAACERGFSAMNHTKTIQHSSLTPKTLDNNLRISIKYQSPKKSERVKSFVLSGHLADAVKHWQEKSLRTRQEYWVEKHPEAKTWSSLKGGKLKH